MAMTEEERQDLEELQEVMAASLGEVGGILEVVSLILSHLAQDKATRTRLLDFLNEAIARSEEAQAESGDNRLRLAQGAHERFLRHFAKVVDNGLTPPRRVLSMLSQGSGWCVLRRAGRRGAEARGRDGQRPAGPRCGSASRGRSGRPDRQATGAGEGAMDGLDDRAPAAPRAFGGSPRCRPPLRGRAYRRPDRVGTAGKEGIEYRPMHAYIPA